MYVLVFASSNDCHPISDLIFLCHRGKELWDIYLTEDYLQARFEILINV